MSLHRRTVQRDLNEGPIVEMLRAAGCSVQRLSIAGAPDLLCGIRGVTFLVEVKNPDRDGKQRRLRENQADWARKWKGSHVWVVESVEEVGPLLSRVTEGRWRDAP